MPRPKTTSRSTTPKTIKAKTWTVTSARPGDKPTRVHIPAHRQAQPDLPKTVPKSSTTKAELERVLKRVKDGMPMTLIADTKLMALMIDAYQLGHWTERPLSMPVLRRQMAALIKGTSGNG